MMSQNEKEKNDMNIEILGTPFNSLGSPPNIENPSEGLRRAGLIRLLEAKGHTVMDNGDLLGYRFNDEKDSETGIKDFHVWIDLSKALLRELRNMLDRKSFLLLLGGDCSMLVGIFAAFAERNQEVGLIFLDGHADFHTTETSTTGDPADMELAVLTGRGPEKITGIAGKYPLLKEEDVVVYGIRAYDNIKQSSILFYDRKHMMKLGIEIAVKEGLRNLTEKSLPLWLHLDVDALDPEFMPVMYPEKGGLTFGELHEFLNLIWASKNIWGMSIACYHPMLDKDSVAASKLVRVIADIL
jgi:arginase